jgi:hypothetical protein
MVIFEFDGISDPDGLKADEAVSRVGQMMSLDEVYEESGASAIWVDDAMVIPTDDDSLIQFEQAFSDLFKPTKKEV